MIFYLIFHAQSYCPKQDGSYSGLNLSLIKLSKTFPSFPKDIQHPPPTTSSSMESNRVLLSNFTISTWLSMGACLQGLLFLVLPRYVALLPAFVLVASRSINAAIITQGWAKNPCLPPEELLRKVTAPIPNEDGSELVKAGEREVVCFLVGANHNQ